MFGVLTAVTVLLFLLLVLVTSMQPVRASVSMFELRRRDKKGDASATFELTREESAEDIQTVLRICSALLLVACVLVAVVTFGWLIGTIVAAGIVLEYGAVARLSPVRFLARNCYARIEVYLLRFTAASRGVLRFVRFQPTTQPPSGIYSKDELIQLVEGTQGVLSKDEVRRLVCGLTFGDKIVSEVMTPRSVIDTVSHDELLGPITLDALYKTGHSRLPVIEDDIDHVVGILHVQDLLVASAKKTRLARDEMEKRVFYIRADQRLEHALSAFLRTRRHLFIVVNEYRETVGVLSLEDVIETLIGKKIIDEFDAHDDLRVVAERNIGRINQPKNHTDV